MRATCGALLSRWATKKAANDATTRRTNAGAREEAQPARRARATAWPGRRPARTMTSASGASACVSSSMRLDGVDPRAARPTPRRLRAEALAVVDGRGLERLVARVGRRRRRARSRPPARAGRRSVPARPFVVVPLSTRDRRLRRSGDAGVASPAALPASWRRRRRRRVRRRRRRRRRRGPGRAPNAVPPSSSTARPASSTIVPAERLARVLRRGPARDGGRAAWPGRRPAGVAVGLRLAQRQRLRARASRRRAARASCAGRRRRGRRRVLVELVGSPVSRGRARRSRRGRAPPVSPRSCSVARAAGLAERVLLVSWPRPPRASPSPRRRLRAAAAAAAPRPRRAPPAPLVLGGLVAGGALLARRPAARPSSVGVASRSPSGAGRGLRASAGGAGTLPLVAGASSSATSSASSVAWACSPVAGARHLGQAPRRRDRAGGLAGRRGHLRRRGARRWPSPGRRRAARAHARAPARGPPTRAGA